MFDKSFYHSAVSARPFLEEKCPYHRRGRALVLRFSWQPAREPQESNEDEGVRYTPETGTLRNQELYSQDSTSCKSEGGET